MELLAFVFPGQGSQQPGMGADLLAADPTYRRLLADASRLSGLDLTAPLHALGDADGAATEAGRLTVTTQLSVFALSVALGRSLLAGGRWPSLVAGHSLGEFSALAVAGWLSLDDALELVAARAAAMARCCASQDGAMTAVIGLAPDTLEPALHGTGAVLANVNSRRQSVVSGPRPAVELAAERARAAGAATIVPLPVAGAFHSPLMAQAQTEFAARIGAVRLVRGDIPLVSGVTGELVDDLADYRRALAQQITAPVRWLDVMAVIDAHGEAGPGGAEQVVEVGPGSVLRGLFRQFNRRRPVLTCGSWADCRGLLPDPDPAALPG